MLYAELGLIVPTIVSGTLAYFDKPWYVWVPFFFLGAINTVTSYGKR